MTWSPWVNCLISAALWQAACSPAPPVQVLGDSTRLARDKSSPRDSAFFDDERVTLRAARGETLGLQVRISDARERTVQLDLPSEIAIVSGFSVASLLVDEPSSEMYGVNDGPGRYPDPLTPEVGEIRSDDLVYFDVSILQGAKPGSYKGQLRIDDRTIPVVLEVSRARIDLTRDPLVWVFYLPKEIARVHGLQDSDDPELVAIEERYHQLFRAHGAFLAADLVPDRFAARRHLIENVEYWPVAVDETSDETITRDVRRWLELFANSDVTPFAIPIDEPQTRQDKLRAKHIAQVIAQAGGGRPEFLRGVTDIADPIYGDSMDIYLSPKNFPQTARARQASGERFWTYNGRPPSAGSMILDTNGVALRTWGWIAERYGIELWYAWEGLYFSDRYNAGGPTDVMVDPLTFDERSKRGPEWGNGDGLLAYPGPLPSMRLKALRRGLQDRLLLRELVACGGRQTATRILQEVVPRALGDARREVSWSLQENDWEKARQEVLDAIEIECDDDAQLAR